MPFTIILVLAILLIVGTIAAVGYHYSSKRAKLKELEELRHQATEKCLVLRLYIRGQERDEIHVTPIEGTRWRVAACHPRSSGYVGVVFEDKDIQSCMKLWPASWHQVLPSYFNEPVVPDATLAAALNRDTQKRAPAPKPEPAPKPQSKSRLDRIVGNDLLPEEDD